MKTLIRSSLVSIGAFAALLAALIPFGAGAMTISPPLFDYTLESGAVMKDAIKLFNETDKPITITPVVMNFMANDAQPGVPDFYPKTEKRNGHELANWISIPVSPIKLAPKERKVLEFSVSLPDEANAFGYYGAVVFSIGNGDAPGTGLIGGTAVLIMVRSAGEAREGSLSANLASKSNFYTHLPADFQVRIENKGGAHEKPTGQIIIKNLFGKPVASLPVNSSLKNILPNSARFFTASWQKTSLSNEASEFRKQWSNFALGPYTASLVLNYGSASQTAVVGTNFWVFPWQVVIFALAVLLVLVWLLFFIIQRYNGWVIGKYGKTRKKK